jgi:hypothetical protein
MPDDDYLMQCVSHCAMPGFAAARQYAARLLTAEQICAGFVLASGSDRASTKL